MQQESQAPRLSSATLYATRAMIEIARANGQLVTSAAVGQRQRVPAHFLDQLLARLRRAALVLSVGGPHGGYALRRPPSSISLADIVAAVDAPVWHAEVSKLRPTFQTEPVALGCPIEEAWGQATAAVHDVMRSTTLDMLVRRQTELADSA
jgi:Rrf2 family protein